ncbi:MAG: transcriptional regulator, partial [Alphaproteobacteria bacterium]|nr:transcriptional regulator [Alphaproteobacteria bacterium]
FCKVLEVPVSFFFVEMPCDMGSQPPSASEVQQATYDEDMLRRETLELVRAYYRIDNRNTRKRIYELVKAVGAGETPVSE